MSESDESSSKFSLANAKSETWFSGIAFAISLTVLGIAFAVSFVATGIPVMTMIALAFLGLVITGCQLLFHGSTVISMTLKGNAKRSFQVAISLIVPCILSLYFLKDATSLTFDGLFGHMFNPWFLFAIGIIVYISWVATDQLDNQHPFRGFLGATVVLFLICFSGHLGLYNGDLDPASETYPTYIDKNAAIRAAQTGQYFGQFLIYVTSSYTSIFLKLNKRWRSK